MKKRRGSLEIAREIYFFLRKESPNEYSINKISKKVKSKYEMTIKCLNLLKDLDLIKETKGSKKPIPERLFSFKR